MMDQAPTLAFKAFGRLRQNKRQDEPRSPGRENLCRPHTHEGTGAGHSNRNGLATLIAQGGGGGATNPMANHT